MALLVFIPLVIYLFSILSVPPAVVPIATVDSTVLMRRIIDNRRDGRVMQALYQVEALAARDGWWPDLYRLAAELWRDAGEPTRALPYLEAAANSQADDAELLRELARAYSDAGRWSQAADMLERLIALDADDARAHYDLGLLLAAFDPLAATAHLQVAALDANYTSAATGMLAAITYNPGDPAETAMRVGAAMADAELWPYAELAFQHAADWGAPDGGPFPAALAYTGIARGRQGKDGGAWLEQALSLAPDDPQVLYLQGLNLRYAGDLEGSLNVLLDLNERLAQEDEPENAAIHAEIGTAYRLMNDMENAERWLNDAVTLSGGDARFQELLALFYSEESYNLSSGGLAALQTMSELDPNDPDMLAAYGWSLYGIGQVEAGLAQIDAALEISTINPRALYYKARILLDTGNVEAAVALFEQVAAQDSPYRNEARRVLESLSGQ